MLPSTKTVQLVSISTALLASGGIATLSLFDIPEFQSQPASRSLPLTRWLFSRGSHIFPTAAFISSAGFAYLAYMAVPSRSQSIMQLPKDPKFRGYLIAAVLTMSIGPFTQFVMIPTNFRLIEMNTQRGGARSAKSASQKEAGATNNRSVEDSVAGKGEAAEFTDFSGPQTQTEQKTTEAENKEVRDLLGKFGKLNAVRATLMGVGGIVGLWTALM